MRTRLGFGRSMRGVSFGDIVIAMLVVVVLVGGGLYYTVQGNGSGGGNPLKGIGSANDAVCKTNLQTLRNKITQQQLMDPSHQFPQSLSSVPDAGTIVCPTGNEPYAYDATTGKVHCTHPGHEDF